ncbi:hypothetical protein J5N97_027070 [Dioscorea zingiberensis]|uniref:DDE Tnp4 domain-containing protein n=1 Tax=Dioscorea zingiberensis TaxID=325984 RepID=A0A9D5C3D5_9LILI|nr:hypothetical protein J5N97_027070 [Dioscorea zingiberensis]
MAAGASKRERPSSSSSSPTPISKKPRSLPADELRPVLSLLISATSLSLRFLSSSSPLLPSSLSSSLSSSLLSSSLSLSRLLSFLHLRPPPPPPPPPSSSSWFLPFLSPSSPSSLWLPYFRMSKPTFDLLLQTLTPALTADFAPPSHKLAAALLRLAHATHFSDLARRFSFASPSLACRAFYEVCRAITDRLGHLFELRSDPRRVLQGFNWMSLPNCLGAVGFSRFLIDGAACGGSVIAQAVVDSEGRFLDVSAGWHGKMTPARILRQTELCKSGASGVLDGAPMELNGGGSVPVYFLGGACCPLLPWLVTPYAEVDEGPGGCGSSSKMECFNSVHSRGMELVDRAFVRLRSRWQLLRVVWKEECAEALPFVIVACCLLHNYLIKCSEPVPEENEATAVESGFPVFEGKGNAEGERVREVIASHLSMVSQITFLV